MQTGKGNMRVDACRASVFRKYEADTLSGMHLKLIPDNWDHRRSARNLGSGLGREWWRFRNRAGKGLGKHFSNQKIIIGTMRTMYRTKWNWMQRMRYSLNFSPRSFADGFPLQKFILLKSPIKNEMVSMIPPPLYGVSPQQSANEVGC